MHTVAETTASVRYYLPKFALNGNVLLRVPDERRPAVTATTTDPILTVREAAEIYKVSPRQMWTWVGDGTVPSFTVGRLRRLRLSDLEALEKRSAPA